MVEIEQNNKIFADGILEGIALVLGTVALAQVLFNRYRSNPNYDG